MEALVYIANLLYLASYFTQDILRLRALTITAAICLVAYFYLRPEPLMTVVCWNLFFVALNVIQIARLLLARRANSAEASISTGDIAYDARSWRAPDPFRGRRPWSLAARNSTGRGEPTELLQKSTITN